MNSLPRFGSECAKGFAYTDGLSSSQRLLKGNAIPGCTALHFETLESISAASQPSKMLTILSFAKVLTIGKIKYEIQSNLTVSHDGRKRRRIVSFTH